MSQQINLFNPAFLKKESAVAVMLLLKILGIAVVALIVGSIVISYQTAKLRTRSLGITTQITAAQEQIAKLDASYIPRPKSQTLTQEIERRQSEEKALQQVFEVLKKDEFGNRKGYSAFLKAFARQSREGVWLTGLSIMGSGSEITLQGRALQASLVPAYLERLKDEPVMQGKSFSSLGMQVPVTVAAATLPGAHTPMKFIEFDLRSTSTGKLFSTGTGVIGK